MKKKNWTLLLAAVVLVSLTGCASLDKKSEKKRKQTAEKKKFDTSWIQEQFHREQVSEHDINRRTLDNFEVFPGRKGFRSRDIETRDPFSF